MSIGSFVGDAVRVCVPVGVLLAGVAGFAAIGQREPPAGRTETVAPPPVVKTLPVLAHPGGLDLKADGLVVPFREVVISAEVAGRVTHKSENCRTGRFVQRGERLFEIDPQSYRIEVSRLEGELAQADAMLQQLDVELSSTERLIKLAESQRSLQQKNTERISSLVARSAVNKAALDEAQQAELTTENGLQTLQNQVELIAARRTTQAKARDIAAVKLQQAQIDLDRTQITAPVDGIVLANDIEENGYVKAGDPLVKLDDVSAVEVRCNLRMEELQWILRDERPGAEGRTQQRPLLPATAVTCRYRLGNVTYEWPGTLSSYDGSGVDERTRTVPVRVLVPDPRKLQPSVTQATPRSSFGLMRGMYVDVVIHLGENLDLLEIPEPAIQPGSIVWRVREGKLQIVPITVAQMEGKSALVDRRTSGLKPGDRLIASPMNFPSEGMAVREENPE